MALALVERRVDGIRRVGKSVRRGAHEKGRGWGLVGARRGEAHLGVREVRTIGAHEAGGGEPLDLLAERGRPRAAVAARGRTAAREEVVHDAPSLAAKASTGAKKSVANARVTFDGRVRSGERTGSGSNGADGAQRTPSPRGGDVVETTSGARSETRHLARLCSSIERMKINGLLKNRKSKASHERPESQTVRFDWRRGFQVASDKISIRDLLLARSAWVRLRPPRAHLTPFERASALRTRYEQRRP